MAPARGSRLGPPAELTDFLAAGPPPICIGFGSMSSRDPERLGELVLEAVRRARVRAVLLSGWGGLAGRGDEDIFVTDEVPHDWLYPKRPPSCTTAAPAPRVRHSPPGCRPSSSPS